MLFSFMRMPAAPFFNKRDGTYSDNFAWRKRKMQGFGPKTHEFCLPFYK